MRRRFLRISIGLSVVLLSAACSPSDSDESTAEKAAGIESADPSNQRSGEGAREASKDTVSGHADQAGGHGGTTTHSSPRLSAALVTADQLPKGYREGAGHHQPGVTTAAAPAVSASCSPIAELIGTHPSVTQDRHPQVTTSFSKGHFGPSITETIIDFDDTAAASKALNTLEAAGQECEQYVQSASPIGANIYSVQPPPNAPGRPNVTWVRLRAIGDDFQAGIVWDIWATRSEGRLVSVAFRSALGGNNDDLYAAFPAAIAAISAA